MEIAFCPETNIANEDCGDGDCNFGVVTLRTSKLCIFSLMYRLTGMADKPPVDITPEKSWNWKKTQSYFSGGEQNPEELSSGIEDHG